MTPTRSASPGLILTALHMVTRAGSCSMVRASSLVVFAWLVAATAAQAQGFKFSNEDPAQQAEKAAAAEREARVQSQLAMPCRDKIKNQKIMVLIGEDRNGTIFASQASYNPHINAINDRLQSLGLKTYSPQEIQTDRASRDQRVFQE